MTKRITPWRCHLGPRVRPLRERDEPLERPAAWQFMHPVPSRTSSSSFAPRLALLSCTFRLIRSSTDTPLPALSRAFLIAPAQHRGAPLAPLGGVEQLP